MDGMSVMTRTLVAEATHVYTSKRFERISSRLTAEDWAVVDSFSYLLMRIDRDQELPIPFGYGDFLSQIGAFEECDNAQWWDSETPEVFPIELVYLHADASEDKTPATLKLAQDEPRSISDEELLQAASESLLGIAQRYAA